MVYDNAMQIAVICQDIRSIHNVGSIFRTADAAGVSKIYLCGITPAPIDRFKKPKPDFTKVSLGAEDFVPWESAKDARAVIEALREDGWVVVALEQAQGSVPYNDPSLRTSTQGKVALVLGPEVEGLSPEILEVVDKIAEIPMSGKKESLNVSVAFGIAVFALRG